ncbi:hypothetical protein [Nannocystis pusilla]|uniref:hypothetical protein n=1 Tax=Nannocystis pusilla TaxID=889268 RepID=UPI003BF069D7
MDATTFILAAALGAAPADEITSVPVPEAREAAPQVPAAADGGSVPEDMSGATGPRGPVIETTSAAVQGTGEPGGAVPAGPVPAGPVAPTGAPARDASKDMPPGTARPPLRERLQFFPYGWIRTDATWYSAPREGYSNISLAGARIGGGVQIGPVTAFVTIEAAQAKGPQLFDAFIAWAAAPRLRLRAGQFKAPFGLRFNAPDLVDELPRAPLSMLAATPGRQVGLEVAYDFWRWAEVTAAVFSGIGQNREANNTKIALAGKVQLSPLAFLRRGPQLLLVASVFAYHKTNGFTPTVTTAFAFDFFHGLPSTGASRRFTAGGGLFWRFLSARGEFFYTYDSRERDTDGDPFTPGDPLPQLIGAGGYAQVGAVVTGQDKDPATLLPRLASRRVRDSAVELSARFERFRVGARDVVGNGITATSAGVNWVLLQHLRVFAAVNWQRLETAIPEIPRATSWGVTGGIAGFFLGRAGRGD